MSLVAPISLDSDEELAGALPKPLVPLRSPVHMTRNSNLFAFPKSRCQEGLDSGKHCGVKSGGLPEFFALLENGTMRSGVHTERGVLIKQWTPVTHGVAFPSQVQFNSEEKPPDFAGFSLNLILHIHVLKTTKTLSHCAFYSIYSNVLASGVRALERLTSKSQSLPRASEGFTEIYALHIETSQTRSLLPNLCFIRFLALGH